ncbi:MAG: permease prefix domain 1-containing protein [Actinomycetia bacterium]|nr:permease prefix domain 1-containing protein [Actinomycetes bacterium]
MRLSEGTWEDWLEEATAGITSNAMARSVRRELRAHLEEIAEGLRADGLSEEEVRGEALRQMGDPHAVGRDWQARVAGSSAVELVALALAAVFQIAGWYWKPYFPYSWLLVGLAVVVSRPLRAWVRDAGIVLAGVARGTVSGLTDTTSWGRTARNIGVVGLVTGFVAATEQLWFGQAVAFLAAWVKEATGVLIMLGTPVSVLAAIRKARRSAGAVDPDGASVQGAVILFIGFVGGAVLGCLTDGVVLTAMRVHTYPNPAVFVTSFAERILVPVTALYAFLVLFLAWATIGTVALRAARSVEGDTTP